MTKSIVPLRWLLLTALLLTATLAPPASAMAPGAEITTPVKGGVYVNGDKKADSPILAGINAASVKGNLGIDVAWECPQGTVSATIKTEIYKVTADANGVKETLVKERTINGGASGSGEGLTWGPAKDSDAGEYKIKVTVTCLDRAKQVLATYTPEITVIWTR